MAPEKRPAPSSSSGDGVANWKRRKRDRAQSARFIQTQQVSQSASLQHSSPSSSAAVPTSGSASRSSRALGGDGTSSAPHHAEPLPPQLDLERAISSRAFQIRSFQKSLKTAKNANATRAWQLLPRHARRRAASHNLLRLPTRLRAKARAELSASKTTARTRSEIRKRLPSHGVIRSTLRRQKLAERAAHPNRRWLETHLWHAKRFRMSIDKGKGKEMDQGVETSRWGFVLPETTMMKSYKASWRSALEKVTVHDASYYAVFRVGAELVQDGGSFQPEGSPFQACDLFDECLEKAGVLGLRFKDLTENLQHMTTLLAESPTALSAISAKSVATELDALQAEAEDAARFKSARDIAAQREERTPSSVYAAIAPLRLIKLHSRQFTSPVTDPRHKAWQATQKPRDRTALEREAPGLYNQKGAEFIPTGSEPEPGLQSDAKRYSSPLLRLNVEELLIIVHPAAALDVRRALKRGGVTMTDEQGAQVPPQDVRARLFATQLENAANPWLAAGGKDLSASKLKKRKRSKGSVPAQAATVAEPDALPILDDEMQRRRQQGFNIFELVGPDAGKLLTGILKLANRRQPAKSKEDGQGGSKPVVTKEVFEAMKLPSRSAGARGLPRHEPARLRENTVMAFEVHDPRLSFPPKLSSLKPASSGTANPINGEPHADLPNSRLLAFGAPPPKFSKGQIDSRRAKLPVPGTRLKPDSRDDVVPVVVIRRQLAPQAPGTSDRGVEGYTLIVPRGWGMPFFLSLVNTHQSGSSKGARVLGQAQIYHQSLEIASLRSEVPSSIPGPEPFSNNGDSSDGWKYDFEGLCFPRDWVGTRAYAGMEREASQLRKEHWQRRPKGKRVEHYFVDHAQSRTTWAPVEVTKAKGLPGDGSREEPVARLHAERQRLTAKMRNDRLGTARPYPFGGTEMWDWAVSNSEALFGTTPTTSSSRPRTVKPWLVPLQMGECYDTATLSQQISETERRLDAAIYSSALVPIKLTAIRKGTVDVLSSVLLPYSFDDQKAWIRHVDWSVHPLAALCSKPARPSVEASEGRTALDRESVKREVERRLERMQLGSAAPPSSTPFRHARKTLQMQGVPLCEDEELDELHGRNADWTRTVGLVLSGDYALGKGKGFGIAAVTLKAWMELVRREERFRAEQQQQQQQQQQRAQTSNGKGNQGATGKKGGRKKRNPIETRYLVLVREVGTDVLRPCTAVPISLSHPSPP